MTRIKTTKEHGFTGKFETVRIEVSGNSQRSKCGTDVRAVLCTANRGLSFGLRLLTAVFYN